MRIGWGGGEYKRRSFRKRSEEPAVRYLHTIIRAYNTRVSKMKKKNPCNILRNAGTKNNILALCIIPYDPRVVSRAVPPSVFHHTVRGTIRNRSAAIIPLRQMTFKRRAAPRRVIIITSAADDGDDFS